MKKRIELEIEKIKIELAMSDYNDGWWNNYMEEKLKKLKVLLNK
jgi:hypothetical protein